MYILKLRVRKDICYNRRLTCLVSTYICDGPVLMMDSMIPSHFWNKFSNRCTVIFFICAKVHIRASGSHPGLKWRAWRDSTITRFNRLRNIHSFLHVCTYCSASPCRKEQLSFQTSEWSRTGRGDKCVKESRGRLLPSDMALPLLQITQVWRVNSWRSVRKNSQSLDNEERLPFRMLRDRKQCFPESQLFTAETFAKAANEEIPLLHF